MHTVSDSTPSIQDQHGRNGATALDGSPEFELTNQQEADLAAWYAENPEPMPTDEEIDRMYAESQARASERELDDIAAEFMVAYERYCQWLLECDQALVEQQKYEAVAKAMEVA